MKLLLSLAVVVVSVLARKQFINVKGTLTCQGDTVENAQVELWEHDIFTPNDLLTSTPTDILGAFEIQGADNEYMDIKPFLMINHFCNAKPNCPRQTRIEVPVSEKPEEVKQLPDIDLTNLREDEDDSCFKKKN